METVRPSTFGGLAALVVTLGTLLFTLLVLLSPSAETDGALPWAFVAADYVLALVGLFGLGAVPAITAWASPVPTPWLRWLSVMAQLGFAVLAVTSFWQAEYELTLLADAETTVSDDDAPALPPNDGAVPFAFMETLLVRAPQGWLDAGLVGLWMMGLGFALLQAGRTATLAHLGLAAGFFSLVTALGATLQHIPLHLTGLAAGGMVLTPVWFARAGVELLRLRRPASQQRLVTPAATRPRDVSRRRWSDRNPMLRRIWNLHGDGS